MFREAVAYLSPPTAVPADPFPPTDDLVAAEIRAATQATWSDQPLPTLAKPAFDWSITIAARSVYGVAERVQARAAAALAANITQQPVTEWAHDLRASGILPDARFDAGQLQVPWEAYADCRVKGTFRLMHLDVQDGMATIPPAAYDPLVMGLLLGPRSHTKIHVRQPTRVPELLAPAAKAVRAYDRGQRSRVQQLQRLGIHEPALPPCMAKLFHVLRSGSVFTHQGRFMFVTFLHRYGMQQEAIVDQFRFSPMFDPDKTRYQVNHILTGKEDRERGTSGYFSPGCAWAKANKLCPDSTCKAVSPTSLYEIRRRSLPEPKA